MGWAFELKVGGTGREREGKGKFGQLGKKSFDRNFTLWIGESIPSFLSFSFSFLKVISVISG